MNPGAELARCDKELRPAPPACPAALAPCKAAVTWALAGCRMLCNAASSNPDAACPPCVIRLSKLFCQLRSKFPIAFAVVEAPYGEEPRPYIELVAFDWSRSWFCVLW